MKHNSVTHRFNNRGGALRRIVDACFFDGIDSRKQAIYTLLAYCFLRTGITPSRINKPIFRLGSGIVTGLWEHLTYAMSINTYRHQQLENLQLDHKEK